MKKRFVALLRAISNVSMKPFRKKMEDLEFKDVESYGMSGNLLFNTKRTDVSTLERLISEQFGTPVMVGTSLQLTKVIANDPFGSSILFLTRAPTAAKRRTFHQLDFDSPRPVIEGKTVYFVNPAHLKGKRASFDFEGALGVLGTARSAQVVRRILALMKD
jgi:uncharacterized protein (DUF1697 family)